MLNKALLEKTAQEVPSLDGLRGTLEQGKALFDQQQQASGEPAIGQARKKSLHRLRNALEKMEPTLFADDKEAVQHDRLMDALRFAVYDTDTNIPGHKRALKGEINEALGDLIRGGAYDDNKLAQVVGEILALEGRAATDATAGRFTAEEIINPDANVSSVGATKKKTAEEEAAAKELAYRLLAQREAAPEQGSPLAP